jgi:hypothetical protein
MCVNFEFHIANLQREIFSAPHRAVRLTTHTVRSFQLYNAGGFDVCANSLRQIVPDDYNLRASVQDAIEQAGPSASSRPT